MGGRGVGERRAPVSTDPAGGRAGRGEREFSRKREAGGNLAKYFTLFALLGELCLTLFVKNSAKIRPFFFY